MSNLSEEEKEAIKSLTKKVELWNKHKPRFLNGEIEEEIDKENNEIQCVLNLIDRLQKENEELKEMEYRIDE